MRPNSAPKPTTCRTTITAPIAARQRRSVRSRLPRNRASRDPRTASSVMPTTLLQGVGNSDRELPWAGPWSAPGQALVTVSVTVAAPAAAATRSVPAFGAETTWAPLTDTRYPPGNWIAGTATWVTAPAANRPVPLARAVAYVSRKTPFANDQDVGVPAT